MVSIASSSTMASTMASSRGASSRCVARAVQRACFARGWERGEETRRTRVEATRTREATGVNAVEAAVRALGRGGVIAVPTDTIYGFACCARDDGAVRRLYEVKGRRTGVPVAIAVGDAKDVGMYGSCAHLDEGMLERILPGPVTVLLRQRAAGDGGGAAVSSALNPDVDLIGVRVPGSDFVREVCRAHGGAIALTSANRSGEASTTSATEFEALWGECDEVFDGGTIDTGRLGSTIVDLSSTDRDFRIVREGERCAELVRVLEDEFDLKKRA
tara:strand:+ start:245 stop:1063 length:819 start_codon:yes stop_codon:yes gene_type:complete